MKYLKQTVLAALLLPLVACGGNQKPQTEAEQITGTTESNTNQVIETIMTRRSIRQYKPQAVNRDTMQIILNCGINAPNGQNKQSWAIRVVDNQDFINGITEVYKKANPNATKDPNFKNMFRNAPTVVFIAHDTAWLSR